MRWFFLIGLVFFSRGLQAAEGSPFRGASSEGAVEFRGMRGFRGVAVFAAMADNFPCEQALRLLASVPYPAMSVLWGTFGDDYSCMVEFLERFKARPHMLQIHLMNGSCRRQNRCLEGEFARYETLDGLNRKLERKDVALMGELSDRIGDVRGFVDSHINHNSVVVLSISLEDNFTPRAASNLRNHVQPRWPYLISRNRVLGITPVGIVESHDLLQDYPDRMCIVNEDGNGQSAQDSMNLLARYDHCLAVLLWRHSWQNFPPPKRGVFVPPRSRKFVITNQHVRELGHVLSRQ